MKALRKALSRVPAPSFDRTTQCDLGLSAIEEARLKDTLAKLKQYYAKNEVYCGFELVLNHIYFLLSIRHKFSLMYL